MICKNMAVSIAKSFYVNIYKTGYVAGYNRFIYWSLNYLVMLTCRAGHILKDAYNSPPF